MENQEIMADMPPAKKKPKPNEARKRLKEIKRWVTDPITGKKQRRSFYGATMEAAERSYALFLRPQSLTGPANSDLETLMALAPEGSFGYIFAHELVPLKASKREATRVGMMHYARHVLPTTIEGYGPVAFIPVKIFTVGVAAKILSQIESRVTLRNPTALDREQHPEIRKKIAPRTVNKCRRLILEVMQIAHEMDSTVPYVRANRLPVRAEEQRQVDTYSPQQMRRLYEASRGHVCEVPVLLYCFLGICLREGLGMKTNALQPNGDLIIREQQVRGRNDETTTDLKTTYRHRVLPLPEEIAAELRRHVTGVHIPMARGKNDQALGESSLRRAIDAAAYRAGLHRLSAHELRHSFSSWLDNHGCPSSVRQALLGQSKREVRHLYNHAETEVMRAWLQRLWEASFEESDEVVILPVINRGGTRTPQKGEDNPKARLKVAQVRDIRARIATESVRALAREFGVSPKTVKKIRDRETWKDIA